MGRAAHAKRIREAFHEAGHAVVAMRLGVSVESAALGVLTGECRAVVTLDEASLNAASPRTVAVIKFAGPAAEIAWDDEWSKDKADAIWFAKQATGGAPDVNAIQACCDECLQEALDMIWADENKAVSAVAQCLFDNYGSVVSGDQLRALVN